MLPAVCFLLGCLQADPSAIPKGELRKAVRPISLQDEGSSPGIEAFCKEAKGAKVIGLGEASHGSHEFFALKTRLIQRLVETQRCRVIAFESGFIQSLGMTRFVAGLDQDADEALRDQWFWTWQTEEVKDLLVWLRNWNKTKPAKDRVLLVGIDVQESTIALSRLGTLLARSGSQALVREPLTFVTGRDLEPEERRRLIMKEADACRVGLRAQLGPDADLLIKLLDRSLPHYFSLSEIVNLQEDLYDRRPSEDQLKEAQETAAKMLKDGSGLSPELKHGLMALSGGLQKPDLFQLQKAERELEAKGLAEMAEVVHFVSILLRLQSENQFTRRDLAMADNIAWLSSQYPASKVAVWAHNSHVMSFSSPAPQLMKSMGSCLRDRLGKDYMRLGFCFSEGHSRAASPDGGLSEQEFLPPKANSWEAGFESLGIESFYLSLTQKDGSLVKWLDQSRPLRQIGAVYSQKTDDSHWQSSRLGDLFDSVIYVLRLTGAKGLRLGEG